MALTLTDDQAAIVESFRDIATREVPGERVRASEPIGFDAALWQMTASIGGLGIGVSVEHGGGGEGLLEAALVVEQLGARLAPVPLVEGLACARLLSGIGTPAALDLLGRLLEAETVVTLALRPATGGTARLVPAGAVAGALLVLVDGALVVDEAPPGERASWTANLGAAPLADWSLGSTPTTLATGADAEAVMARAVDEWRVLTAAALVGLAAGALELGVAYAKERSQFGHPIAGFQSVSHGLADAATEIDGARLLVYEAAWALEERTTEAPALASMAVVYAAEVANHAAYVSLHYHGGYGFMQEYDIQLYYRRARAWSSILGSADDELLLLADRLWPLAGGA